MWPWGHVAVAYLLYSGYCRSSHDRPPLGAAAIVLVIASQVPDLIDKPLGWSLAVLPGGRTLAHSLFGTVAIVTIVALFAHRIDRMELAGAYAVGHGAHLLADLPIDLPLGNVDDAIYLLWPLLEPPEYRQVDGILAGFLRFDLGPYELVQIGLFVIAIAVWYADGRPGLATARAMYTRAET